MMLIIDKQPFIKKYIFIRRYILWVAIFHKTSKQASEIKQRKLVSGRFPSKNIAVNFGWHFCQLSLKIIENLTKTNKMPA